MTPEQQEQLILSYANYEPSVCYANCEECGTQIPIELTLCADCAWAKE